MKKLAFLAIAITAFASSFAQTLTARFSDLNVDSALIVCQIDGKAHYDTLLCKNGTFTYDYTGTKALQAYFMPLFPDGHRDYHTIYLIPGEQAQLTGSFANPTWSGTSFYTDYAKAREAISPLEAKRSAFIKEFGEKIAVTSNPDSLRSAMMPIYNRMGDQIADECLKFVKANPGSNASASLLSYINNPIQCEEALNALTPEVKAGPFAEYLTTQQQYVDRKRAQREAAKLVADGCEAPDFTLKDINGNDLTLSSLRGQIVVLDFWGSWCGWCIKGFPEMKKYYEKYAGKFEILGVDCGDTDEKWKKAVAENSLPWKHVYNPRSNDIAPKYAITGYPTKIVIGPDGKIMKTVVGEDPAFYTYLDQILQ